jgi:hypothetical protein
MHGRLDVDAMLADMSAEQFEEWRAFDFIEPFGPYRDGINAAVVAQSLAGGKLADHIPKFGITLDDQMAQVRAWLESREEAKRIRGEQFRRTIGNRDAEQSAVSPQPQRNGGADEGAKR